MTEKVILGIDKYLKESYWLERDNRDHPPIILWLHGKIDKYNRTGEWGERARYEQLLSMWQDYLKLPKEPYIPEDYIHNDYKEEVKVSVRSDAEVMEYEDEGCEGGGCKI